MGIAKWDTGAGDAAPADAAGAGNPGTPAAARPAGPPGPVSDGGTIADGRPAADDPETLALRTVDPGARPAAAHPAAAGTAAPGAAADARAAAGRSAVVVSDLDRTLIYSSPNALMLAGDGPRPKLRCVEVYRGRPLSYLTEDSARLLAELAAETVFVPATTRTREQYARVRLPIPRPRYAITTNGGRLLVDGAPDPDWDRRVQRALGGCAPLSEVQSYLLREADRDWLRQHRVAEELFVYLVVERDRLPSGWVGHLREWAAPRGWTVSLQGRKVYLVPAPLTKSAAMDEVRRRIGGGLPCLAAGDSLLDAEILQAADAGFRPGHGELAEAQWTSPTVTALAETGVEAGERLVERLLAAARAGRR